MENEIMQKYSIGIDVGGTNIHVALVATDGSIIRQVGFATCEYPDADGFVKKLCKVIIGIISETGVAVVDECSGRVSERNCRVVGIGIGVPCANPKTKCIENPADLPWKGVTPLGQMLESATGLDVWMANDANAAAIGEMTYGCAKGMDSFIEITLGTGVGSGIVVDGRVLNGTHGFAGELGHMTFGFTSDRLCSCGRVGCLQTYCTASGITETARKLLDATHVPSILRNLPDGQLTAKAIGDAYLQGDEIAAQVWYSTEEILGKAFAEFCAFCDPEAIILFGGVADSRELNASHIKEVMDRHMLYLYRDTKILFSTLPGAHAAILGAASLPWQKR